MNKQLFLAFYLLLLISECMQSQNLSNISALLDSANNETLFFLKRVKYAERTIELAKSENANENMLNAHLALGKIYISNNTYDKALTYLKNAYKIAQELNNKKDITQIDYLFGRIYTDVKNFESARNQFLKTIDEAKEINDSILIGQIYSSLGTLYSKERKIDSSLVFYKTSLFFLNSAENIIKQPVYINIGDYFLELKKPDSALYYLDKSLVLDSIFQTRAISITYVNKGLAYAMKKQYKMALIYYRKSLEICKKYSYRDVVYANYLEISRIYEKRQLLDSALFYFKQYTLLKDSIFNKDVLEKIHQYQDYVELEKKDKELAITKQNEKIANFKNYLFFFFGLFVVILGLILFLRQRLVNRAKIEVMKKNRKLQLIKFELANREIEAKKKEAIMLTDELEKKKHDLLNFGLDISRKNQFFKTLKEEIRKAMTSNEEDHRNIIKNLNIVLKNHTRINDELSLFQQNIENVNQEFISKLSNEFPNITQLEINHCGMIKIGLSIKEISAIRNVSPKSVEMSRYRLRKKLNLPKDVDLTRFLKEY